MEYFLSTVFNLFAAIEMNFNYFWNSNFFLFFFTYRNFNQWCALNYPSQHSQSNIALCDTSLFSLHLIFRTANTPYSSLSPYSAFLSPLNLFSCYFSPLSTTSQHFCLISLFLYLCFLGFCWRTHRRTNQRI